jgi:tRNA-Thr(GGU) m(6)t(6)A37 methyltransferase TsaA
MELTCPLPAIGVVRTGHRELETTPIQAGLNRAEQATLEVDERYRDGLDGLAGFDCAWLITWLGRPDRAGPAPLRQVPFLLRRQRRDVGIFATRGPRRVNPLGLSLVRLLSVTAGTVEFAGVDLLDGTAVLDLKPYVTRFDQPPGAPRCGWFDELAIRDGVTPSDLR